MILANPTYADWDEFPGRGGGAVEGGGGGGRGVLVQKQTQFIRRLTNSMEIGNLPQYMVWVWVLCMTFILLF